MNSGSWASYRSAGALGDDARYPDPFEGPPSRTRSFHRRREIKRTRKPHTCLICNHEIPAGSPATYEVELNEHTDYQLERFYMCTLGRCCAEEPETDHERVPDGEIPF